MNHQKHRGFTLIEMMVVVAVMGIVTIMAAPTVKAIIDGPSSQQIYDFATTAASNWRIINMKCATIPDTAASPVVATPSVTNSLGLVASGSSFLNAAYTTCYNAANVEPLHTKISGNATSGFTLASYPLTWSGGSQATPAISFTIQGVAVSKVVPLYNQYSSAAGASTAITLPAAADTTDPIIQFSAPAGGVTNLTINVQ